MMGYVTLNGTIFVIFCSCLYILFSLVLFCCHFLPPLFWYTTSKLWCLEVKGEIVRTVLCCIVYWSCAQSWAHLSEWYLQLSRLGFVTVVLFCCALIYFCLCVCILCFFCFLLHNCCIIVSTVGWTRWDWSLILRTYLPSVLWHCCLGHMTGKNPQYHL